MNSKKWPEWLTRKERFILVHHDDKGVLGYIARRLSKGFMYV